MEHVKRFVAFHEAYPKKTQIFRNKRIFLGHNVENEPQISFYNAQQLFLDSPIEETGLSLLTGLFSKRRLWSGYNKLDTKRPFVNLVKALGIQSKLEIHNVGCFSNPNRKELRVDKTYGARWKENTGINNDWIIYGISYFADKPKTDCSRILWNTVTKALPEVLKAKYRSNDRYDTQESDSQLICWLKNGNHLKPDYCSRSVNVFIKIFISLVLRDR